MRLDSKMRLALFAALLLFLLSLVRAGQNITWNENFEPFTSAYKLFSRAIGNRQGVLTVNNGRGGGAYPTGSLVKVSANRPPNGQRFASWTGDIVILSNPFMETTTAIVPSIAVTITATYCAAEPTN